MLLDAGIPAGERDRAGLSPLHYASVRGHVETVRVLLQKGADVDGWDGTGRGGRELTAICAAANAGHEEIVKVLLEAGASVGLAGALFSAGAAGHSRVVEMLFASVRVMGAAKGGDEVDDGGSV